MPELPEVEVVKNFLYSNFNGKRIQKIKIINKKLRYEIKSNIAKNFINLIIKNIYRRGKYLILSFENGSSLLVHLGMTGYFRVSTNKKLIKHDHITFYFKSKFLIYNDIRKFGFIKFYKPRELTTSRHLTRIGPEPFTREYNFNYFKLHSKKTTNIKNLLMNQSFVAGLGNIYCSEILFDAQINPKKICKNLNNQQIRHIISSTRKILNKAIKLGGTTIKNFIVSDEKIGYFKNELKVYGKENSDCIRCLKLGKIKKIIQNGRSTFYCSNCQK